MPVSNKFDGLRVVLVAARNPLNIGAAARAMSNFGIHHLRVVNPYEAAFREARSAVGASALLESAEEYSAIAEAVADCTLVVGTTAVRHRKLQHPVQRPEIGAEIIRKQLGVGPVALLFGSERVGLSNDEISHCHWLIRIPTCEENISMNLGQAVAVSLYELVRETEASTQPEERTAATAGDVERITELLRDSLRISGYPGPENATEQKIRRLIRRMNLSNYDAEIWLGVTRQILWKLNHPQSPGRE
jgi:TrmH family RNA methyltransferase